MNQQKLKNVLDLHRKWVMGEAGGVRANLSSANLSSADLRYADLRSADLRYADLRYADLRSADLRYADLRYADLRSANLRYADLSSADLRYADLSSADLRYADLRSADLRYADLRYAKCEEIKQDFFKRLEIAKSEVIGLYDHLIRGKIEGKVYQGECACFIGTIANIRKESHEKLSIPLKPEANSLTEKWFLAIGKGDTPDNNPVSRLTSEWMQEWMKKEGLVIPRYQLFSSLEKPELFV